MNIEPAVLEKADPLLRRALSEAQGNEELTAIMLLRSDGPDLEDDTPLPRLRRDAFPNRLAYRQALIERQQEQVSRAIGQTLKELRALTLEPQAGILSKTVVVRGSADKLRESLRLKGVAHASLDREIHLIQPRVSPAVG